MIRGYRAAQRSGTATLIVEDVQPEVGLTVVADPDGDVDDLALLRQQLQVQTSQDWELVSAAVPADDESERIASLAALVASARGAYVAFVARSEEIGPRWVEQFVDAARVTVPGGATGGDVSGCVVRCAPATSVAGEYRSIDPGRQPGADHPVSAVYAFPTAAVRQLDGAFDGRAHAAVGLFLRLAPLCGVSDTFAPAVLPGNRVTTPTWTLDSPVELPSVSAMLGVGERTPVTRPGAGGRTRSAARGQRRGHPRQRLAQHRTVARLDPARASPAEATGFGRLTNPYSPKSRRMVSTMSASSGRATMRARPAAPSARRRSASSTSSRSAEDASARSGSADCVPLG